MRKRIGILVCGMAYALAAYFLGRTFGNDDLHTACLAIVIVVGCVTTLLVED